MEQKKKEGLASKRVIEILLIISIISLLVFGLLIQFSIIPLGDSSAVPETTSGQVGLMIIEPPKEQSMVNTNGQKTS